MIRHSALFFRRWLALVSAPKRPTRQKSARLGVEALEDRITPTAGSQQQFMLELVNQMRQNPAAELQLLLNANDPDIDSALSYFNVNLADLESQWSSLVAAPALAWNDQLALSATNHSQAMLTAGVQSHQVTGEADLGTRITAAGYTNWSDLGENIYAYADSIFSAHGAFAIDWGSTPTGIQSPAGHRENIMDASFRDLGIGIVAAPTNSPVGPLLITQDFGNNFSYGNPYLVGVVYNDANSNGFYDEGEGIAGATLTITGAGGTTTTTTTAAYAGYQLKLSHGTYTIDGLRRQLLDAVDTDGYHRREQRSPRFHLRLPAAERADRLHRQFQPPQ